MPKTKQTKRKLKLNLKSPRLRQLISEKQFKSVFHSAISSPLCFCVSVVNKMLGLFFLLYSS